MVGPRRDVLSEIASRIQRKQNLCPEHHSTMDSTVREVLSMNNQWETGYPKPSNGSNIAGSAETFAPDMYSSAETFAPDMYDDQPLLQSIDPADYRVEEPLWLMVGTLLAMSAIAGLMAGAVIGVMWQK
jgi:hypothetical protein